MTYSSAYGTMGEAARSGMSIREFCRQRRLKESQFYWWQHKLSPRRPSGQERRRRPGGHAGAASFALVSGDAGMTDAGIELVLGDGRRLRIRQGVDEETLRAVLAALFVREQYLCPANAEGGRTGKLRCPSP